MKKLLDKSAILAAPDLKTERVDVQEWGGELIVSEMGGLTMLEFFDCVFGTERDKEPRINAAFKAALVAFSVVDDTGALVFAAEDIPRLARKKAAVLDRVFQVADRLSCITDAAREAAGKNSLGEEAGADPCLSSPESSASPALNTSAAS